MWKTVKFLGIALGVATLGVSAAVAQSSTYYDWQSGNSITSNRIGDTTYTNGFNTRSGTTWNMQQRSNGSFSGTDSNGNAFWGNHNSDTYFNSDGTICVGQKAARVCN